MNSSPNRRKNNSGFAGLIFAILAALLVILMISSVVLLIALSGKTDSGNNTQSENNNSVPTSTKPQNGTENSGSSNGAPLFPTTPSRSNYISTSASGATKLTSEITSYNTILVELGGYTSTVEKNADDKIYPASMTKVMTLLVACERVTELDKRLTVDDDARAFKEAQDASGLLVRESIGLSFTVKDLLYILFFDSDTAACFMLAKEVAGSEATFVELMNAKATELGLTKTHFTNSTGLYDENHYTTCREMAAIMAYALDNTLANEIITCTDTINPMGRDEATKETIRYWSTPSWYKNRFDYKSVLDTVTVKGAKTGYIDESGTSLVSYAESSDGKRYINVIVGIPRTANSSTSTKEVKYIYNNYAK